MRKRPAPIQGGERRASINLGGVLGAFGLGTPTQTPGFIPEGEMQGMDVVPATAQNATQPYQSPGFFGRLAGNNADELNQKYQMDKLIGANELGRAKDLSTFQNEQKLNSLARELFIKDTGLLPEENPDLWGAGRQAYAQKAQERRLAEASASTAEANQRRGNANRGEELSNIAHPYNTEITDIGGQSKLKMAQGELGRTDLINKGLDVEAKASPLETYFKVRRMGILPINEGDNIMDISPYGDFLKSFPSRTEIQFNTLQDKPAPGIQSTPLNGSITIDGITIPRKGLDPIAKELGIGYDNFNSGGSSVGGNIGSPNRADSSSIQQPPGLNTLHTKLKMPSMSIPESIDIPGMATKGLEGAAEGLGRFGQTIGTPVNAAKDVGKEMLSNPLGYLEDVVLPFYQGKQTPEMGGPINGNAIPLNTTNLLQKLRRKLMAPDAPTNLDYR